MREDYPPVANSFELVSAAEREGITRFTVGAIIVSDGKVLLVRRKPEDFLGGYWEFPGGGVEEGEALKDAVRREVREETGLKVIRISGCVGYFDYNSENGELTRQFNFMVEVEKGEISLSEHDQWGFVSMGEISRIRVTSEIESVARQVLQKQ